MGRDWRGLKTFALALAIAIIGMQLLIIFGLFDSGRTTYVPAHVPWLSAAIGSVLFGLGMAFVGTCAFGSLVRLGSGDLRSLISMLVFGTVAYATLRGMLSSLRIDVLERVSLPMPGAVASEWPGILNHLTAQDVRLPVALIAAIALGGWALRDARLRQTRRLLTAGLVLGMAIIAGWCVTGILADDFSNNVRVQSLTFVAPVARALFAVAGSHAEWLDFGVMTVPGVVLGAFIHAKSKTQFRWEAYDDHHEMRRHLTGAVLMGFGGVLAGGCTIGQGLTAGSLMAVTWPVTVAGMILGARLGIAILMEGSLRELLRSHFSSHGAK